ncbi:MAG: transporter substrate-binding domain-containing protein, partial [Lachnospiraceae bacterium]
MKHQFTRTAALALILITLVSLLVGYKDIAKPAVAEAAQINHADYPIELAGVKTLHSDVEAEDTLDDVTTAVPQYTSIDELSGKVVSCLTGSVSDIFIGSVVSNVTFSYFNTQTDALVALQNEKVEAVPLDEPLARLAIARNADLTILPEQIVEDHYGIALQKDSPLTDQVNATIAKLRADGTLEQMNEKWIGSNESAKTLPELDYPGANGT